MIGGAQCDVGVFELEDPPAATTNTVNAGSPQQTEILIAYTTQLSVLVKDQYGNPFQGATVTFTAPASSAIGTFVDSGNNITNAVTGADGIATAVVFTANNTNGAYTVAATVSGIAGSADFSLTNYTLTATTLSINDGNSQLSEISNAYSTQLSVLVVDQHGKPYQGATVTFTAPASGTFSDSGNNATTASTGADGISTSAVYTANSTAGTYSVDATVSGIGSPASFSLENYQLTATTMTIQVGDNQNTLVSTAYSTQLSVLVKDQFDNPMTGVTVTFTAPASSANGTFSDSGNNVTTAVTGGDGIATAAVFTANSTEGDYSLNTTVSGIASPNCNLVSDKGYWQFLCFL